MSDAVPITEPLPTRLRDVEAQIAGERGVGADGDDDGTARLRAGQQSTGRVGSYSRRARPEQQHIEAIDHRGQYIGPHRVAEAGRWIDGWLGHHHQSRWHHPYLGCGRQTDVGKSGDSDPCTFLRGLGS